MGIGIVSGILPVSEDVQRVDSSRILRFMNLERRIGLSDVPLTLLSGSIEMEELKKDLEEQGLFVIDLVPILGLREDQLYVTSAYNVVPRGKEKSELVFNFEGVWRIVSKDKTFDKIPECLTLTPQWVYRVWEIGLMERQAGFSDYKLASINLVEEGFRSLGLGFGNLSSGPPQENVPMAFEVYTGKKGEIGILHYRRGYIPTRSLGSFCIDEEPKDLTPWSFYLGGKGFRLIP